ncbi:MAG: GNAT family N-acetyltransferase [Microlunatus sp.]|nr:GNAT family N-acetyltransferase [Microlunatus sp.]
MPRHLRPMIPADLDLIPEPCADCVFWESSLDDFMSADHHGDRAETKHRWATAMTRQWGYCGVIATDGRELLGYATVAPARLVPRLGALGTTPFTPSAAVLLTTRVVEPYRGRGLGRQMIQSVAGLMVRRDVRAIDAVGSYGKGPSCLPPVGFLQQVGFAVVRPHPMSPRLRMDLSATARWRPDLGAAWSRLTELIPQPVTGPEPARRETRSVAAHGAGPVS